MQEESERKNKNVCIVEILRAIIQKGYIVFCAQSKEFADNKVR